LKYPVDRFLGLTTTGPELRNDVADVPTDIEPVSIDVAGLAPDDPIAILIRHGDNRERPIGSKDAAFPSRSEVVFKVTTSLVRRGFALSKVAGLLLNEAHGVSVSVLETSNPLGYAWRQTQRAVAVIECGWPDARKGGAPIARYRNAVLCLLRLEDEIRSDVFRLRITAEGRPIQQFAGDLSDDILAALRKIAADKVRFDPGKAYVADPPMCLLWRTHFTLFRTI